MTDQSKTETVTVKAVTHATVEPATPQAIADEDVLMAVDQLDFFYNEDAQALWEIDLKIPRNQVTALIGPSGCGKSTLLRCLNRMNDVIEGTRHNGTIHLEGVEIFDPQVDAVALRRHIGMVFQKPNPFPKTIYENIAYGVKLHEKLDKKALDERVEWALRKADLWEEVQDRLDQPCLLYTSPSPRDQRGSRMPSSA